MNYNYAECVHFKRIYGKIDDRTHSDNTSVDDMTAAAAAACRWL